MKFASFLSFYMVPEHFSSSREVSNKGAKEYAYYFPSYLKHLYIERTYTAGNCCKFCNSSKRRLRKG